MRALRARRKEQMLVARRRRTLDHLKDYVEGGCVSDSSAFWLDWLRLSPVLMHDPQLAQSTDESWLRGTLDPSGPVHCTSSGLRKVGTGTNANDDPDRPGQRDCVPPLHFGAGLVALRVRYARWWQDREQYPGHLIGPHSYLTPAGVEAGSCDPESRRCRSRSRPRSAGRSTPRRGRGAFRGGRGGCGERPSGHG
jgi:hypothetical protein